jgi:hypothetical protein
MCRAEIVAQHFEAQLAPEQLGSYLSYAAMKAIEPGEMQVQCTVCPYFEIHSKATNFFFCKGCPEVHCYHCKASLPAIASDEDDDETMDKQDVMAEHFECEELASAKTAVEKALDEGGVMPCPGCGLLGRKDGACTHMQCVKCATVWCYFCGDDANKCDKASRTGAAASEPLYGHNEDWETNEHRCPMYLSAICEVDEGMAFDAFISCLLSLTSAIVLSAPRLARWR